MNGTEYRVQNKATLKSTDLQQVPRAQNEEKSVSSKNGVGKIEYQHEEKGTMISPYTKINWKG